MSKNNMYEPKGNSCTTGKYIRTMAHNGHCIWVMSTNSVDSEIVLTRTGEDTLQIRGLSEFDVGCIAKCAEDFIKELKKEDTSDE